MAPSFDTLYGKCNAHNESRVININLSEYKGENMI